MSIPICSSTEVCTPARYAYAVAQSIEEVWRPALGYEHGYEVSSLGRVRSIPRVVVGSDGKRRQLGSVLLKQRPIWSGYLHVSLWKNGIPKRKSVHRLVLEAFVGPNPVDMEACHNNGEKTDNRIANLRWDTKSANARDKVRHGGSHEANKTHCVHGHPFDVENTYLRPDGRGRVCKRCLYLRNRARVDRLRPVRAVPNGQKTHCIHGHEFTEENTYAKPLGGRQCRTCQSALQRNAYMNRKD